ncbi:hypothetical protein, partial [Streptomyces sp. NPDC044948]|uniref:hypothetical protein n=1 Tax=Streptomyces sp. NPDC044948 TaxID=3157092 RepID=UPI0034048CB2
VVLGLLVVLSRPAFLPLFTGDSAVKDTALPAASPRGPTPRPCPATPHPAALAPPTTFTAQPPSPPVRSAR